MNDLMISRDSLKSYLPQGESAEADNGYFGEAPEVINYPKSFTCKEEKVKMQKRICSCHESLN